MKTVVSALNWRLDKQNTTGKLNTFSSQSLSPKVEFNFINKLLNDSVEHIPQPRPKSPFSVNQT